MSQAVRALLTVALTVVVCLPGQVGAQAIVPSVPLNLAASVANDTLTVTWDPPASGAPILAYLLQITGPAVPPGVSLPVLATSFALDVEGMPPTTLTFAVSATNAMGAGPVSAPVSVVIGPTALPTAPRNVAVSVAAGVLSLTWDPPVSGELLTSYELFATTPSGPATIVVPASTTSFSAYIGNNPVGTLTFAVRAVNPLGAGPLSPSVTLTLGPTGVPSVPLNVAAGVVNGTLTFSWSPPATGAPIDRYELFAGTSGLGGGLLVPGTQTSFSAPVGAATATLHLSVRAWNFFGAGPLASITVSFGPTAAPDPPEHLVARVTGSTLQITWDPPSTGAPVDSYVLRATGSAFPGVWTLPTSGTSFSADASQMAWGNYAFTVSAVNPLGESGPTAPATVTIGPPCPVPAAPVLSGSRTGNVLSLAWTTPGGGAVTSYTLLVSLVSPSGGTNQMAADVGLVNAIAGPVAPGTYLLQIRPQSACGPGAASNQLGLIVP